MSMPINSSTAFTASSEVIKNATTFQEAVKAIYLISRESADCIKSNIKFGEKTYSQLTHEVNLNPRSREIILNTLKEFHVRAKSTKSDSQRKPATYQVTAATSTSKPEVLPEELLDTVLPRTESWVLAEFLGNNRKMTPVSLGEALKFTGCERGDVRSKNANYGLQEAYAHCLDVFRSHNPSGCTLKFFMDCTRKADHPKLIAMAETANKEAKQEKIARQAEEIQHQRRADKMRQEDEARDRFVFGSGSSKKSPRQTSAYVTTNESKLLELSNKYKDGFKTVLAGLKVTINDLENATLSNVSRSDFSQIAAYVEYVSLLNTSFPSTESKAADYKRAAYNSTQQGAMDLLSDIPKTMNLLDFCIKLTNSQGLVCTRKAVNILKQAKLI